MKEVSESTVFIKGDGDKCKGCGTCEMICSLFHEGECSPSLSRISPVTDQIKLEFSDPIVCEQCDFPACYYACPVDAIHIDEDTGARKINQDECIGCKACMEACYYDPPRIKYDPERDVCIKCDLCGGDPQCVEYCPDNALEAVSTENRPNYPKMEGKNE